MTYRAVWSWKAVLLASVGMVVFLVRRWPDYRDGSTFDTLEAWTSRGCAH